MFGKKTNGPADATVLGCGWRVATRHVAAEKSARGEDAECVMHMQSDDVAGYTTARSSWGAQIGISTDIWVMNRHDVGRMGLVDCFLETIQNWRSKRVGRLH